MKTLQPLDDFDTILEQILNICAELIENEASGSDFLPANFVQEMQWELKLDVLKTKLSKQE